MKGKIYTVRVGSLVVGLKQPLVLISGPCVIDSERECFQVAEAVAAICEKKGIGYVFKASYDKANRSSIHSYRGPGLKRGLKILKHIKDTLGIPILTDVHQVEEVKVTAEVADILQIPAFLCRQTDLLCAAARTQRVVNVKKGQFISPQEVKNIIEKIESCRNHRILITERGALFGYQNLVVDMRSFPILRQYGYPVIFDATHSVQRPGAGGDRSSGDREYIPVLVRAAAGAGIDGLFMEVLFQPAKSKSDAGNIFPINQLERLLDQVIRIHQVYQGL